MTLFAVIRRRGDAWERSLPIEGQQAWRPHADFMNRLAREGFALLSGPLGDSEEVLLICRAERAADVAPILAADPWTELGLLETVRIAPWTLRIGSLR